MSVLVGRCLPGRPRDRRRKLQPPLSQGQPSHATLTQSSGECRSENQRKHLRNRVSPFCLAPGTQSNHLSHRPSTVPTELVDPAPRSPLRRTRTRASRQQTVAATAHVEDDPATPKARVSDRTGESSTKPAGGDFRPWSSSSNCGVRPARANDSRACFCEEFKERASAGVNIVPLHHAKHLL